MSSHGVSLRIPRMWPKYKVSPHFRSATPWPRARLRPFLPPLSLCARQVAVVTVSQLWRKSRPACYTTGVSMASMSLFRTAPAHPAVAPAEREIAKTEPSKHWLIRMIRRLGKCLDDWILEPLLTMRRLAHILFLFIPVALTAPAALLSKADKGEDHKGTLWWYDFLSTQMERAGPTFIKLAQWIASRTDLFPLALCARLSKLHSQVEPHPFSYTRRVIEEAFGCPLENVFSELEETPLGVGAIAQVHKAKIRPDVLQGEAQRDFILAEHVVSDDAVHTLDKDKLPVRLQTAVAIKVLHPKARQLVNRDLKIMDFFARWLTLIPTMHWLSLPEEVAVFGEMMKDQLDLRVEATNLQRFNDYFVESMQIKFPRPLTLFTTKDMLMEEYEKGIPLSVFLEQAAYARKTGDTHGVFDRKIAGIGLDAFLHMLIFHNFVHADLHPGNILVKLYKPSAYHPVQRAWSRLLGRDLKDDGDSAVERVLAVRDDPARLRGELEQLEEEGYSPRLVFIDAGLVNELNEVNRANFLDLFRAVAHFDGYRAGELMVERCRTPELVLEPNVFALRMQHLILNLKQNTFHLGVVKIGNLLHEAMNMVRAHHVKLEGDFVNVIVSTMLLEGIGRQLDPNLDLFKNALPVLRDYSIKDGGKATLKGLKDAKEHGSTPHWIKVWLFLELRNWFGRDTRDDEWLQLW